MRLSHLFSLFIVPCLQRVDLESFEFTVLQSNGCLAELVFLKFPNDRNV